MSHTLLLIGNVCLAVACLLNLLELYRIRRYVRDHLKHLYCMLKVMNGLSGGESEGKQYRVRPVSGDIRMASKLTEETSKTSFAYTGSGADQPPK